MQILHTEPVSTVWIDNIVCFLAAKTISVYIYVIINIEWNAHLNYKWHVSVLHRQFSILKFRRAPFRVRHIHIWGKVFLLTNINSHILKRGIRLYFSLPFNWYFAGMRGREKKKKTKAHISTTMDILLTNSSGQWRYRFTSGWCLLQKGRPSLC